MIREHQSGVSEFRHESEKPRNPDVRSYVSNTPPVPREHLRMAEDANAKLGASAKK